MNTKARWIRTSLAATSLAAAAVALPSAVAGATTSPSAAEQKLMLQLQLRQTQLKALSGEVSSSTSLTAGDQAALEQKIALATSSIDGLVQSVPTDTPAQLRAARRTMIYQNRVFAVLTPQAYEVIASDTVAGEASAAAALEGGLQSQVNAASGQVGYKNAEAHYVAYVSAVSAAQAATARVSATLLAQAPTSFPHDRAVFVRMNRQILTAGEALARASYDKTIVALATDGYTGS